MVYPEEIKILVQEQVLINSSDFGPPEVIVGQLGQEEMRSSLLTPILGISSPRLSAGLEEGGEIVAAMKGRSIWITFSTQRAMRSSGSIWSEVWINWASGRMWFTQMMASTLAAADTCWMSPAR